MKSKKRSIIKSLIIFIISLFVFTILNFHIYPECIRKWLDIWLPVSDLKNYLIVISSGVFTSSFVTLLISDSEYKAERQTGLEDFHDANIRFVANLYKLDYLRIDIPLDLLKDYYLYPNISDIKKGQERDCEIESPQEKIMDYIWERAPEFEKIKYDTPSSKRVYLREKLNEKIAEYDKQISIIVRQYIDIADKMDINDLNQTFGRIDFLCRNKKYREKFLYEKIYLKQIELFGKITNASDNFKEKYEVSKDNKYVIVRTIIEIQKYLFSVTQKEECEVIYKQYLFSMDCELYKLSQIIYGKNKGVSRPQIEDYEWGCCK